MAGDSVNTSDSAPTDPDRSQKTADNIRYGQNISESGMGGMTQGQTGEAGQAGGYGGAPDQIGQHRDTRAQQGYGAGSDIGA
jgi:hypothetical protein